MIWRRRFLLLAAAWMVALCGQGSGEEAPKTAEEVIQKYVQAIGGREKIASISSFAEKGETFGNLDGFGRPYAAPGLQKQRRTFELYFKAPSLRLSMWLGEGRDLLLMTGCDGSTAWYIGQDAIRHESKPKPGSEHECKPGYEPLPLLRVAPNVKLQLRGRKNLRGQAAWAVRVQDPKSSFTETYYFDAQTYLLLRSEIVANESAFSAVPSQLNRSYSDYREVGGIKLPFMIVEESEGSTLTTTLREVEVNAPLDDARFRKPKIEGDPGKWRVQLGMPAKDSAAGASSQHSSPPAKMEASATMPTPPGRAPPGPASVVTTNFVTSSIAELQQLVPELRKLKPEEDQTNLSGLLDKIGERTMDISGKVPNLIANEEVVYSEFGGKPTRQKFSYLILARRGQDQVTLEEYRIDLKTGATLETDEALELPSASVSATQWDELAQASQRSNIRDTGGPPLSQGFASMWVRFYPTNRQEATFRYLGQQKLDGHPTLVLAFAEKPGSVRLPGLVRFQDRSVTVYYQGIAWVNPSDYTILRLRTDLLSPTFDLGLTQLTAEVEFARTQAAGFATPLWLPRVVDATSQVNGHTYRDKHTYSNYRSFQAHAKLLIP